MVYHIIVFIIIHLIVVYTGQDQIFRSHRSFHIVFLFVTNVLSISAEMREVVPTGKEVFLNEGEV